MLTGDWGISYKYARPVGAIVGERVLNTVQLVAASLVIAGLVAVPLGVIAATARPAIQRLIGAVSMLGVSVPTFWLGIVVLLLFSVKLRLLPSGGMATLGAQFSLTDRLWHLLAPAAVLATLEIAGWSRYLRSMLLEALRRTSCAPRAPRVWPRAAWCCATLSATPFCRSSPCSVFRAGGSWEGR